MTNKSKKLMSRGRGPNKVQGVGKSRKINKRGEGGGGGYPRMT